jgi:hypothetical protein
MLGGLKSYKNGGEGDEVGEPNCSTFAVVCVEFESYPEPNILDNGELTTLCAFYGTHKRVAEEIGKSRVFVTEGMKKPPKPMR